MLKRWASCEDAGGGVLINTGASVGVDLDRNKSWHEISARSPLVRLSAPGEQQAVSHPVPAREAADRLASLQMANLLVAAPSPPTFGALSLRDLKARLQTTQDGRRRLSITHKCLIHLREARSKNLESDESVVIHC
ncbi:MULTISPECIES: hypothetical protein [unclassified Bradyrhizobium]|uniref:hypothetical protein n=1 Tax=unclassified Bradyrhizobium TaxID=2631580 RepID=UPI001FF9A01B|nr:MULTISPECIES: hypothetical protein [unclassified Bradyrhizobium]MCK1592890.1 hypothetical protein [Bradyrhizobium sp. 169]MCK1676804.1 hypothetical protein [Bradyrhizobium sp. 150]UPJ79432.1 hypothetical protein IVB17_32755 [Bradyrhizobium sp. 184]UPJ87228.1 hypothetical protein IVB16_32760 [Bradyrhizobium sp. 183]